MDKIPVYPAFMLGADLVIAVDISADLQEARDYRRGVDIMVRANSIKDAALVAQSRRMADLVIEPAVRDVHWADFANYERCIDAGDAAASAALPQIKNLLRRERWFSVLRPGRGKKMARLYERAVNGEIHVD